MANAGSIYRNFVKSFAPPKTGDLQVWWVPQIPCPAFEWRVADFAQAAVLLDALAAYDDFQFAKRIKGDYCNTGGLQIFDGTEWCEWEDDEGDDFDAWRDKQKRAA